MKRGGYLKRNVEKARAWLNNRKPLERKTPIKKVNRKRRAKLRQINYGAKGDWITKQACAVCGGGPTVPAHAPYTKAARTGNRYLLPFCVPCETEFHRVGVASFAKNHGLTVPRLERMALAWELAWRREVER